MIFTSVVYAGLGEEMLFRGFILSRILPKGKALSIVISSLMWSSLHLWYLPVLGSTGIWQHLQVTITGLIFGFAYVQTRNLIPMILAHSYMNILLPLSFLYPENVVNSVASLVMIAGVVTSATVLIQKLFNVHWRISR